MNNKDRVLFILGVFCFIYWFADVLNVIFLVKRPGFILWYSTSGLLLTSIALMLRSPLLISTMFCALFVMESMWSLDFFGRVFFNNHFWGLTNYLFEPSYGKLNFFMAMYHILMPVVLLYALLRTRTIFRYSWLGSMLYASTLGFLTYFLVDRAEIVNCVHQLTRCRGFFLFIFNAVPRPYHVITTILVAAILIYIPTNYILLKLAKKARWKTI